MNIRSFILTAIFHEDSQFLVGPLRDLIMQNTVNLPEHGHLVPMTHSVLKNVADSESAHFPGKQLLALGIVGAHFGDGNVSGRFRVVVIGLNVRSEFQHHTALPKGTRCGQTREMMMRPRHLSKYVSFQSECKEREREYLIIMNERTTFDFEIMSCSLVMGSVGRD